MGMETIIISTENHETYSSISNFFIDYYMTDANGEFVKVYLYLVRIMNSRRAVTVADIADHFNLTEKDICRAIRYWISKDVLRLEYTQSNKLSGITLLPLSPRKSESDLDNIALFTPQINLGGDTQNVREDSKKRVKAVEVEETIVEEKKTPKKTVYAPTAILEKKKTDEAFSQILYMTTTYFDRDMTQAETNTLMYIYDELKFEASLLEYLVDYCVTADKKNIRYIEKVAIDWYEKGIKTVADAKAEAETFNSMYLSVLKHLGINRKQPTQTEASYIDKWYKDYAFDKNIILEACNRALTNSPQSASIKYVNGILESWHKSDVRKLSDIEELDKKWNENKKKSTKKVVSTNNQFTNFTQTDMGDKLDELDKLFLDEINAK